ncbi:MAG: PDZ domain-containing protein, partial [Planctomycetota bacterium]
LPGARGDFRNLQCTKDGLLVVDNVQGSGLTLKSYDLKSKKLNTTKAGVSSFRVSYDGKHVLYRAGSSWNLSDSRVKSGTRVSPSKMRVRTEPEKEWPQILREVWRIQRDYFYDPNMHGVDWDAMWERWSVFLPHVRHRADLNTLIAEMIGELCCGHEYVSGGQVPRAPSGVATGLLGCDWEIADGKYRVAKIYRGQNWNPGLRSPLTELGADVNEGDYLVSVDGVPVEASKNLYHAFQNTSGRQLEIKVSKNADGSDARTSTIIPLSSESQLRRLAWVEDCRRRVDELSGGRLAYAYMPNTGGAGMAAFDRDFYSQVDKEGLILDERYNGGGKIADYVIDILAREPICYWMNREGWTGRTPFATMTGPKVMIINESAGSGGDAMPWMFRKLGIGPLVGTRTWGGLVGISGYPALMDGGSVTSASFGIMDTDGEWVVENEGVAPDHEVVEYPKDIMAGRDPQLEKAVQLAMEALERTKPEAIPGYKPPKTR